MGDGQRAAQVDAEHEVPQLLVGVDEEREAVGPGVVDEHVDRAEAALDLADGRAHRRRIRHVQPAAEAVELASHLPGLGLRDVADRHARPLGCEQPRGRGPDPRGAARHERCLALEPHRQKPILGRRAVQPPRPRRDHRRIRRARLRARGAPGAHGRADRDRLARRRPRPRNGAARSRARAGRGVRRPRQRDGCRGRRHGGAERPVPQPGRDARQRQGGAARGPAADRRDRAARGGGRRARDADARCLAGLGGAAGGRDGAQRACGSSPRCTRSPRPR